MQCPGTVTRRLSIGACLGTCRLSIHSIGICPGTVQRLLSMGTCLGSLPSVHGNFSRYHASFPWELVYVSMPDVRRNLSSSHIGTSPLLHGHCLDTMPAVSCPGTKFPVHGNLSRYHVSRKWEPVHCVQVPRFLSMGTCPVSRYHVSRECPGTKFPVHGNFSW